MLVGWREATSRALYGPRGFFVSGAGPAAHFRTSVHASPLFAAAVLALAGRLGLRSVLDLGAGRGELLVQLAALDPSLWLAGVEVAPRPADLPAAIGWLAALPARLPATLVVANEWLDDVPVDVAVRGASGWRLVLVDPATGDEAPGPPVADASWLAQWWPSARPGVRAEIGAPRDDAWADVVSRLEGGAALAVDYAHLAADRCSGAYDGGTLTAYRRGQQVRPVPDGSCDVTSHVALDAVAAAGVLAGATNALLLRQRAALPLLGVRAPRLEPGGEPSAYLHALARAGELAELTAAGGLGDFQWLLQTVGLPPLR